ncbi:MAG: S8 family serine peptidase [Kineosporiaceae bacterium]
MTRTSRPADLAPATSGRRRAWTAALCAASAAGLAALTVAGGPARAAPGAAPAPADAERAACASAVAGPVTAAQVDSERRAAGTSRRVTCLSRWSPGTASTTAQQQRALAQARRQAQAAATASPSASKPKSKTKTTPAPGGGDALPLPKKGLRPADIAEIYALDATKGAGATVAIVVAYDNPQVEADLAVYRATFGLAPCTTANGCFTKVNQRGGATPPAASTGWALEIALDTQAVSAACPRCKIILVEADSDDLDDVGVASRTAASLGADVVSHSYGTAEFDGVLAYDAKYYSTSGVPNVVASGDHGYGAAFYPAVLPDAIAVGGTKVIKNKKGVWVHSAWVDASSGCSQYVPQPAWQTVAACPMRATSDISAVADTRTGLAVYSTYGYRGWVVVGGTSLSAPLVASMIAQSGEAASLTDASPLYAATSGLLDVAKGSNGDCTSVLCKSRIGWDGPTGLGSPQGYSAF